MTDLPERVPVLEQIARTTEKTLVEIRADIRDLRRDVKGNIDTLRAELRGEISGAAHRYRRTRPRCAHRGLGATSAGCWASCSAALPACSPQWRTVSDGCNACLLFSVPPEIRPCRNVRRRPHRPPACSRCLGFSPRKRSRSRSVARPIRSGANANAGASASPKSVRAFASPRRRSLNTSKIRRRNHAG